MFATAILANMGLLTILKKMKQKEKEMRLLMLYPLYCTLSKIYYVCKEDKFVKIFEDKQMITRGLLL